MFCNSITKCYRISDSEHRIEIRCENLHNLGGRRLVVQAFKTDFDVKGQIISRGLLVSSNSPKKRTNEFVFTITTNSFVRFLGEFEDTKKSFRNYLTFTIAMIVTLS